MSFVIREGDPRDPQVVALLEASHALMENLFPPEDNHFLSIDALCVPEIRFRVAVDGDVVLGCGAVAVKDGYGELKSMFTAQSARGRGVAEAIVVALGDVAREAGLKALKLETGNALGAALRLYERCGFTYCGPFGDYAANDTSVFMEKGL
jgi:putative acetyltransferase